MRYHEELESIQKQRLAKIRNLAEKANVFCKGNNYSKEFPYKIEIKFAIPGREEQLVAITIQNYFPSESHATKKLGVDVVYIHKQHHAQPETKSISITLLETNGIWDASDNISDEELDFIIGVLNSTKGTENTQNN